MKISVQLSEDDLRQLVLKKIQEEMPEADIQMEHVKIETKSTQNYRAEWEVAAFRARVEREL